MKNKIFILNTGGTFNKVYNCIKGKLEVLNDNNILYKIIKSSFSNNLSVLEIDGIIYKDSLDITNKDRFLILDKIKNYDKVVIVHVTDTINQTAAFLYQHLKDNKIVVVTGAMNPFIVDNIEATSNLSIAIFFLLNFNKKGIFISMNGLVEDYRKIQKNRIKGIFELVKTK